MNLSAVEKVLSEGKKITTLYSAIAAQVHKAEATGGDYYYMQALLSHVSWEENDFYKYVCPPGACKEFVLGCLKNLAGQNSKIEAEAIRLFEEAKQAELVGEQPKTKKKDR